MFERFTERARRAMSLASLEAQRLKHDHLGTEHLLLGILKEGTGVGAGVLQDLGVDCEAVRQEIERRSHGPNTANPPANPKQTSRLLRVFDYANEESAALNHNYIGTEHLLLGILREPDGTAAKSLTCLNIQADAIRAAIRGKVDSSPGAVSVLCDQAVKDLSAAGTNLPAETVRSVAEALVKAGWRPRP